MPLEFQPCSTLAVVGLTLNQESQLCLSVKYEGLMPTNCSKAIVWCLFRTLSRPAVLVLIVVIAKTVQNSLKRR